MKKKIFSLIFCVFCAVIVYAQNGLWTDEGNYSAEWFGSQYPSKEFHIKNAEELAAGIHSKIRRSFWMQISICRNITGCLRECRQEMFL